MNGSLKSRDNFVTEVVHLCKITLLFPFQNAIFICSETLQKIPVIEIRGDL